ncbi:MAG: LysR family transcriptional regulator [Acidihalobacter sp.]|uniref:LysR family transcriptional regulator n=1 Tax=Acidihalobacter sp. TaxID=1872108 RepID=UPI00307E171F
MQWDDVRYFLILSRTESLSGAARQLRVEHSTVARRVDALEQTLGLRLFERLPRGWTLTAEGQALAARATRLDDEALAFARAAVGASAFEGTVRISAPPVPASHLLVPSLAKRQSEWRDINLDVVGESREANLARGEADIAIRMSRPTAPGLVVRRVGRMRYGLYGTPQWLSRPEADWRFVGYDDSLRAVPQQRWLEQVAQGRPFVLRSNDLTSLLHAARSGLGITILPRFLAADTSELMAIPDHDEPAPRTIWLVMHPDLKRAPRIRLITDLLAYILKDTSATC